MVVIMNNWHFANKDPEIERAAGGQGEIKFSRLSPEELEAFRAANPAPANAKKPIPIYEYNKRRRARE
ncbi:hypothetical protein AWJ19_03190 [Paenibacillus sp. DMB5]|nr:hypothetical protein AWJ19_03190 [Paenibacillus sp. DMB5]